ncbi:cysteine hydrolase [Pseudoduganella danionis]|uniref:Cysteine hydrolase n=1 Tax=Pseudoduganella danionis TaxID=1890295 RepID=A0ABW9SQ20_9BURK|nr:cysteine hydrolase [Pseudoduganella danionis]MTW33298.1 cysteine hydrolase [Pseudoduganella danionis]
MSRKLHLLIIDPQNDFCDLPAAYCPVDPVSAQVRAPALPVAGAHQDMLRLARLINYGRDALSEISITLDSHHRYDVAHPTFWQRADGSAVTPFTEISAAAVRAGEFQPRQPVALPRVLHYLDQLEATGRYRLMVWPLHCEIGSWGHNVHEDVRQAYAQWEDAQQRVVHKLNKGSNPWTEHYSAVMAEVPDADDPETALNTAFIARLAQADVIYVAGEAGSHCVKATVEHIVAHIGADMVARLALITDCMSPVAGFEAAYQDFLQAMQARGVRLLTAEQAQAELVASA